MPMSKFLIKQCKLAATVTVSYTHNFACMNVHAEPFYVHKNQWMQILNLSSPEQQVVVTFMGKTDFKISFSDVFLKTDT